MAVNFNRVIDAMARGKLMTPDMLRDDDPDIIELQGRGRTKGRNMSYGQEVRPCPCECNRGGFCGGCGHAGCGGRRR